MLAAHKHPNGPAGFLQLPEVFELFRYLGTQVHSGFQSPKSEGVEEN